VTGSAARLGGSPVGARAGARTPPLEDSGSTCGKGQELEVLRGKEIILATLVDHPDLTVLLSVRIRPNLVHLTLYKIDVLVFACMDTECVPTGLGRRRFSSHASR
jgi:hypothetical protein